MVRPKRRLLAALLAGLCVATPLAAAPSVPVPAAGDAAPRSAADRLVRQLFPAAIVDMEMLVARRAFDTTLQSDKAGREMKAADPELPEILWQAVAPELRADFVGRQPDLWSKLAALYAKRLSTSELEALSEFFASDTGQKMLRTMYAQVDYTPVIAEAVKHPDRGVSKEATTRMVEAAKAKTIASVGASMTAADEEAYDRLGRAVTQARMTEVSKEAQALILAWVNEPTPARDARVEKIISATVQRYLATHKRAS